MMNDNKNALLESEEAEDQSEEFDFDELERQLEEGLEDSLSELKFLEEDKEKISNPENLGNAVMGVVWDQFVIQIGTVAGEDFIKENRGIRLDLRDEAHIQTTENFANGKIASHNTEIDYQQRYDDWQSNFKKDENGQVIKKIDKRSGTEKEVLIDEARKPYDKNRPKGSKQVNIDDIVPVAEQVRDPATNAHLTLDERVAFGNSEINLNPMDASANQSKGDSTMSEWLDSERNGERPADRFDIDEADLREKDKAAREEYEKVKKEGEERSIKAGKKSQRNEAFRIGGKALRAAVMGLLAELVRNIISKLVSWLKSKEKNLKTFLGQVKTAIATFLRNVKQNLLTAGTTVASTVLSAIFGPVVGAIQKIWTLIKQGGKSVKEAIDYVKAPENRRKSFGVLMLEVGKIVMTGLTAMGALVLGEVIEKALMTFPVFAAEIPLIGSLANIIGIFLGAVVAGIAGALVMNLIDRLIAKKQKQEITERQIDKGNEVLAKQAQVIAVNQEQLRRQKAKTGEIIKARHEAAVEVMREATENIFTEKKNDNAERLADMKAVLDQI
ncbi:cation diffusion facilitator family transporter [Eisenbergiella tayi]|nr:cation diffusion facilitator family transporter [Eisenbergiella tayi]